MKLPVGCPVQNPPSLPKMKLPIPYSNLPKIGRQCNPPPPPGIEKLKSQVNVTFWFSGQSDILVLADVPPTPEIEIGLNMNAIAKSHFKRGHQVHFTIYRLPFPVPLSDSMPEQKTGEFQFQMDMDIWTWTPSATPLQPKKWNAHFWIMLNFWWSAGLIDGPEPHLPPLSSQKKWNAHFWIMFNFWWLARLVNGLKPHLPPLSSQKKWNAHFWIMFNFWWLARLVNGLKPHLPPLSS